MSERSEGIGSTACSRMMPVTGEWSRKEHRHLPNLKIPWAMLADHDQQAIRNHAGQDLNRLWERHGISACEALAILDDRPWHAMGTEESHAELARRIEVYSANINISHGAKK